MGTQARGTAFGRGRGRRAGAKPPVSVAADADSHAEPAVEDLASPSSGSDNESQVFRDFVYEEDARDDSGIFGIARDDDPDDPRGDFGY